VLKQRIVTALILVPVVLAGLFLLTDLYFALFIAAFILTAGWEYAGFCGYGRSLRFLYAGAVALVMAGAYSIDHRIALGVGLLWLCLAVALVLLYPRGVRYWNGAWQMPLIGLAVLVPPWIALVELNSFAHSNFLILLLLFLIWGADIGAYFVGRAFGTRKLAPELSPGKSWAGFGGGMALAALVVLVAFLWGRDLLAPQQWWLFFALCMMVAVISVIGDLTESMFKRNCGVKDSSQLLPGHGGFMDRIDSLVAAAPLFALAAMLVGWS